MSASNAAQENVSYGKTEELTRQEYFAERALLLEARQRSYQRAEQMVTGGATGALLLSITFVDKLTHAGKRRRSSGSRRRLGHSARRSRFELAFSVRERTGFRPRDPSPRSGRSRRAQAMELGGSAKQCADSNVHGTPRTWDIHAGSFCVRQCTISTIEVSMAKPSVPVPRPPVVPPSTIHNRRLHQQFQR